MHKKSFLRPILLFGIITIIFASCDKDFNELGTDIVGEDHFGFDVDSTLTVNAYNQKLGPIASNNLPINPLGFYSNPAFGTTQANFVTQLELSSTSPVFNNTDTDLYVDLPTIDSVIVDVPYFKTLKTANSDGTNEYLLDSIYGEAVRSANSKFKLSLYQSNYYLRDLDPNQSLAEQQLFYTDQNNLIDNNKVPVLLNNDADSRENDQFYFDNREHALKTYKSDGVTLIDPAPRSVPSMRLHLRTDVFYDKILNAPSGQLESNTLFKNYFRGIYFKAENGNPGNMAMLNFKAGKITIYYKEDKITPDNVNTTENEYKKERVSKSFPLNFTGNTISLLQNSNENIDYLNAANSPQEASRLYLKGGEGSMAIIDLFGSTDLFRYDIKKNSDGIAVDENNVIVPLDASGKPTTNHYFIYYKNAVPNGVPDELDDLKFPLIDDNPAQIYHSIKNRWMINEANLTFKVDKSAMSNFFPATTEAQPVEPNRVFLYDLTNKKVLVDYTFDFTTNGIQPKLGKIVHDGIVQTENVSDGRGNRAKKFRVRITNYVRNLIKNDSTNVRLGLSVTENINNVGLSKLRTPNSNLTGAPTMSVLSPLGTILYGTSPVVPDDKKLKLKIYYTKPN
ncbi:DUF4270 domain-containing protein [Flavobacterium paronense]|uniref:DUF4270 domain-containing protein n=1 Tax=Flavobacterium paronense TaxID=1392775 RepID=A0ABV5GE97_9FLAO|nr:DUF4270 domain-containing protein [Flavobacterium paronense]MDN3678274.1 DUF4270 domain-containing protein [Flavobacterium paronense]